ncbi:hypothetical protein Ahy_A04g019696 [Arachis hypogaea]|uniref:Acylamino-acid-releasing enzyme N-terminal domain-containing protein n=1 Tax=Arachis hypogaea TaxID=3818 RepID=A0A445DGH0_ARAHY|nr:hypothetical protein Ahy_A04g019696 [Arachis hypogaea]
MSVLIEVLLDSTERRTCELALMVLDQLSGCAEVSSSPVDIPQLKYGTLVEKEKETGNSEWSWLDVSNPIFKCSDKALVQMQDVASAINALQFYANVQPTISFTVDLAVDFNGASCSVSCFSTCSIFINKRFHMSMIELYVEFEQHIGLDTVGKEVNMNELGNMMWEEENNNSEEEFKTNYEVDDENDDGN